MLDLLERRGCVALVMEMGWNEASRGTKFLLIPSSCISCGHCCLVRGAMTAGRSNAKTKYVYLGMDVAGQGFSWMLAAIRKKRCRQEGALWVLKAENGSL